MATRKKRKRSQRARPRRPDARLVQFEERKRVATRALRGNEVRIGRDPTSDLIVDYANVSRHHAVVRELGDRNLVLDLGSTNGVQVNGVPIGGKPRLLEQGDIIQLSDQVVLLYEEGPFASSVPWVATAVAMLVALAAAVGLYVSVSAASENRGPKTDSVGTDSGTPASSAGRDGWYAVPPGGPLGDAGDPG